MYDDNLHTLTELMNKWISEEAWPEDLCDALVCSIYKKGDPKKQEHYRPISLLNSIYTIIAGVTKDRIDKQLEETSRTRSTDSERTEARLNQYS